MRRVPVGRMRKANLLRRGPTPRGWVTGGIATGADMNALLPDGWVWHPHERPGPPYIHTLSGDMTGPHFTLTDDDSTPFHPEPRRPWWRGWWRRALH